MTNEQKTAYRVYVNRYAARRNSKEEHKLITDAMIGEHIVKYSYECDADYLLDAIVEKARRIIGNAIKGARRNDNEQVDFSLDELYYLFEEAARLLKKGNVKDVEVLLG